jgi:transposase
MPAGLENVVVQAAAPVRLIEGGVPTEATVAQVLVSKYADHLPLYHPDLCPAGHSALESDMASPSCSGSSI